MIIECPTCNAKVDSVIIGKKSYGPNEYDSEPFRIALAECPVCKNLMLGESWMVQVGPTDSEWSMANRLWPEPNKEFHNSIPKNVRKSLAEAKKCYRAQAFAACAVMCGRAIEGVCADKKTKRRGFSQGLRDLRDGQIIEKRLFEWGEALRVLRNIGAHANDEDVSQEDAHDALDFASAFCEYVYELSSKYELFIDRQKSKKTEKKDRRDITKGLGS